MVWNDHRTEVDQDADHSALVVDRGCFPFKTNSPSLLAIRRAAGGRREKEDVLL
jgi:hypothetical protein